MNTHKQSERPWYHEYHQNDNRHQLSAGSASLTARRCVIVRRPMKGY